MQIDRIEKIHIRKFILHLQQEARTPRSNKNLSGATIQVYIRTLKAFFAWAEREEYIPANLMAKIPVPKAEIKVIGTFTEVQLQSLFSLCLSSNGHSIRNMVILLLLLDCGLHVSELVGIKLNDINLKDGIIKISKAKGDRERYVPVGSIVQKTLWKYINTSRPESFSPMVNNLILNDNGLPLTKNGVQQILRRYGRKAGILGVLQYCPNPTPRSISQVFKTNVWGGRSR